MKVIVDRDLCEGNARCVQLAPNVFQLDDKDVLHITQPTDEQRDAVEAAIAVCPRQALKLLDS